MVSKGSKTVSKASKMLKKKADPSRKCMFNDNYNRISIHALFNT